MRTCCPTSDENEQPAMTLSHSGSPLDGRELTPESTRCDFISQSSVSGQSQSRLRAVRTATSLMGTLTGRGALGMSGLLVRSHFLM